MHPTKDTYEFEATLDAYEGKGDDATRVFSKNCRRIVKRDFN